MISHSIIGFIILLLSLTIIHVKGFKNNRFSPLKKTSANILKSKLTNDENFPKSINSIASTSINRLFQSYIALSSSILLTNTLFLSKSSAIDSNQVVAVIGASGRTGRLCVEYLIKQGIQVQPIYREIPSKNPFEGNSLVIKPISADVTKPESLVNALTVNGLSSIIFAASASSKGGKADLVDSQGVANVANVAIQLKIPRLVVISSAAITKPESLGFKFTNIFGRIMEYKLKGELLLQEAYARANDPSLSYVIVRPGGLTDGEAIGVKNIVLNQGDTIVGDIHRADVAQATVAAAISKTIPNNVIFEIYESGKGNPLESRFPTVSGYERDGQVLGDSYDVLFQGLKSGINGL